MKRRLSSGIRWWPWLVGVALVAAAPPVTADTIDGAEAATAVATTWMEVLVEQDRVRLELETGVPDLIAFEKVLPDDFRVRMGLSPDPSGERRQEFFTDELVLRVGDGPPIPGRLTSFETSWRWPPDPLTGERRSSRAGLGMPVVRAVLDWDLPDRPSTLRLEAAMVSGGRYRATIALATHHIGIPVSDAAVLRGPLVLELDWERPWLSRVREPELGRTIDSPLVVVLAVGSDQARVEVVARPLDLQRWVDVGVAEATSLSPEDQQKVVNRVADLVAANVELVVDGEQMTPALDRAELGERRLQPVAADWSARDLPVDGAFARVVLARTLSVVPAEVELRWGLLPEGGADVTGVVIGQSGPRQVELTPDASQLRWSAEAVRSMIPASVPRPPPAVLRPALWLCIAMIAALGLMLIKATARAAGGAGSWQRVAALGTATVVLVLAAWVAARTIELDDQRARTIVSSVLENIYLAGSCADERLGAAALDPWVADDLIQMVTEVARRPGERAGRGRDLAMISGVELVDLHSSRLGRGFVAQCRWNVVVTVTHWGHVHRRVGRESAELVFEPVRGIWTLTSWSPATPEAG